MTIALDLTGAELTAIAVDAGRAAFPGITPTPAIETDAARRRLAERASMERPMQAEALTSLLQPVWNATLLVSVDVLTAPHRTIRLVHADEQHATEQAQVGAVYRLTPVGRQTLLKRLARIARVEDRGTVPRELTQRELTWPEWAAQVSHPSTDQAVVTITVCHQEGTRVKARQLGWFDFGSGPYWLEDPRPDTLRLVPVTADDVRDRLEGVIGDSEAPAEKVSWS